MVGETGFKPATFRTQTERSDQAELLSVIINPLKCIEFRLR